MTVLASAGELMHDEAPSNSSTTTMSNTAPKRRAKPAASDDRESSDEATDSKRHKAVASQQQAPTAGTPKLQGIYPMNSTMSSQAAFYRESPGARAQNLAPGAQPGQQPDGSLPPLTAPAQRGIKGNLPPLQLASGPPPEAFDVLSKGQQLLASGQVPDHLLELLRGTIAQIERAGGSAANIAGLGQLPPNFSNADGARSGVPDDKGELGGPAFPEASPGAVEPPPRLMSQATPLASRMGGVATVDARGSHGFGASLPGNGALSRNGRAIKVRTRDDTQSCTVGHERGVSCCHLHVAASRCSE